MKINVENFKAICEEYVKSPTQKFGMSLPTDTNQELQILAEIFDRAAIMQLIGECDRQGLECYFSAFGFSETIISEIVPIGIFVVVPR